MIRFREMQIEGGWECSYIYSDAADALSFSHELSRSPALQWDLFWTGFGLLGSAVLPVRLVR